MAGPGGPKTKWGGAPQPVAEDRASGRPKDFEENEKTPFREASVASGRLKISAPPLTFEPKTRRARLVCVVVNAPLATTRQAQQRLPHKLQDAGRQRRTARRHGDRPQHVDQIHLPNGPGSRTLRAKAEAME